MGAGNALAWVSLGWGIVTSGVAFLVLPAPMGGVAALALLAVVGAVVARLDVTHPYVWYGPLFVLYHASVPILFMAGLWARGDALREVTLVSWLSLAAFMVAVGPSRVRWDRMPTPDSFRLMSTWLLGIASFVLTGLYLWAIFSGGYTTKLEITLGSSPLLRLDPAFSVLTLTLALLIGSEMQRKRVPVTLIAASIAWFGLAFAVGGERDLLFRLAWVVLVVWHVVYRRLSHTTWALAAVIGALMINVLAQLKNVLVQDVEEDPVAAQVANLASMYPDEFITASDNLQTLLSQSPWPPLHGQTILWDAQQVLRLGFLGQSPGPAPTMLFNLHFFPDVVAAGGGRGFTFVGEGYMNFGVVGAMLWMAALGLFARLLYHRSPRTLTTLATYALSMPLFVYVTRADLSNLMSQWLKHILLPVALIAILAELVRVATARTPTVAPEPLR